MTMPVTVMRSHMRPIGVRSGPRRRWFAATTPRRCAFPICVATAVTIGARWSVSTLLAAMLASRMAPTVPSEPVVRKMAEMIAEARPRPAGSWNATGSC